MRTVDPARRSGRRATSRRSSTTPCSRRARPRRTSRAFAPRRGRTASRASACTREHVPEVRHLLAGTAALTIAVVDFPRGEGTTAARAEEAAAAVAAGAEEIDVVLPLPALLAGRYEAVLDDLRGVVRGGEGPGEGDPRDGPAHARPEGRRPRRCRAAAGAAFVKTSTGFGGGGATVEDVALLRDGGRRRARREGVGRGADRRPGAGHDPRRREPRGRVRLRRHRARHVLIVAIARGAVKIRLMDRRRFVILVADSAGCGALPDARAYGDEGSDTLGNTSRAVGGLSLPVLGRMGLGHLTSILGVPPDPIARRVPRPDGGALAGEGHDHRALGDDGDRPVGGARALPAAASRRRSSSRSCARRASRASSGTRPRAAR